MGACGCILLHRCGIHIWLLVVIGLHLIYSATASEHTVSHLCVLDAKGSHDCKEDPLASLQHLERESQQCSKGDSGCWCMKAIAYTNDVRRRHGRGKMLKSGPMTQLNNAERYAGALANIGNLVHQDLAAATNEVGCNRRIGGENIAYNYESGDVALSCVRQWEKSKPHLENILGDFDEVVIGFFKAENGRVYCVQTFSVVDSASLGGTGNTAQCASVTNGAQEEPRNEERAIPSHSDKNEEPTDDAYLTMTENKGRIDIEGGEKSEHAPKRSLQTAHDKREKNSSADIDGFDGSERNGEQTPEVQESLQQIRGTEKPVATIALDADNNPNINFVEGLLSEMHEKNDHLLENIGSTGDSGQKQSEDGEDELGGGNKDEGEGDFPQKEYEGSQDHVGGKKIEAIEDNEPETEKNNFNMGNRACRCLELGKKCWLSLGRQTENLCTPFLPIKQQSVGCKMICCSYCLTKPKSRRCSNKAVKRLCRNVMKVVDNKM